MTCQETLWRLTLRSCRAQEGHSNAMPAFRNAQTAGGGLLPNDKIPASFVAQAFDAAEPAGGDEVRT